MVILTACCFTYAECLLKVMVQFEQARNIQTEKSFYYGLNMFLLSTLVTSLSIMPAQSAQCLFFLSIKLSRPTSLIRWPTYRMQ